MFLWTRRSARWEPSHTGVLPGRRDVRRNSCTQISLSDGRWRHRVCHCHHETHQRDHLDQILDGKTGACPFLGSVARDTKRELPWVDRGTSASGIAPGTRKKRAPGRVACPWVVLLLMQFPSSLSALAFLLFGDLPSRQTVLKGINHEINYGKKRSPCLWSESANKCWGRVGFALVLLFDELLPFFFLFSFNGKCNYFFLPSWEARGRDSHYSLSVAVAW